MTTSRSDNNIMRVAVVGAGITGAVAASELVKLVNHNIHQHHQSKTSSSSSSSAKDINNKSSDDDSHHHHSCDNLQVQVVLFDQGRRGPGGRASHRSVSIATRQVLADDWNDIQDYRRGNYFDDSSQGDDNSTNNNNKKTFQFDHGCQFFRADSRMMQEDLLESWLEKGWVEPWNARFGCLTNNDDDVLDGVNFFGIPSSSLSNEQKADDKNETVYIGVGGMHLLPRRILHECSQHSSPPSMEDDDNSTPHPLVVVHRGTRVQRVFRNQEQQSGKKWNLETIGGSAAYHDTSTSTTTNTKEPPTTIYDNFDAVLFTDVSSSMDDWHRASAGIPDSFRAKLPNPIIRIPLFSCMIALSHPIRQWLPYDAFTNTTDNKLWFAAVSQSKPGMYTQSNDDDDKKSSRPECWTLISTPAFALEEIQSTTMRDATTGEFKPQENSYLNTIPGPALADAFLETIRPFVMVPKEEHSNNDEHHRKMPEIVYLQAQRWGSALPAPESLVKSTVDICGTTYASELKTLSMVFPRPSTTTTTSCNKQDDDDFVAEDDLGLYYAGDFVSHRNPGLEAAALSGLEVARHMWNHHHLQRKRQQS